MSQFENEVTKVVAKALLNKVDLEKVAEKLAPKVEAAIEKDFINAFRDGTFSDAIYDSGIMDDLIDGVADVLLKKLGIPPKKKK